MSDASHTLEKGPDPRSLSSLPDEAEVVRRILRSLAGIEYGSVEIIIQDSKVVQIERTQRSRFAQPLEIPKVVSRGDDSISPR